MTISSLKEVDLKESELKAFLINYINKIIEFDIALGRNKDNFFKQNFDFITHNIEDFRKRGFRVFIGGGNIFFLKIENKITGWVGTCLQIRGLAQRTIKMWERRQ